MIYINNSNYVLEEILFSCYFYALLHHIICIISNNIHIDWTYKHTSYIINSVSILRRTMILTNRKIKMKITTPTVKTTHVPTITPNVICILFDGVLCKPVDTVPFPRGKKNKNFHYKSHKYEYNCNLCGKHLKTFWYYVSSKSNTRFFQKYFFFNLIKNMKKKELWRKNEQSEQITNLLQVTHALKLSYAVNKS